MREEGERKEEDLETQGRLGSRGVVRGVLGAQQEGGGPQGVEAGENRVK